MSLNFCIEVHQRLTPNRVDQSNELTYPNLAVLGEILNAVLTLKIFDIFEQNEEDSRYSHEKNKQTKTKQKKNKKKKKNNNNKTTKTNKLPFIAPPLPLSSRKIWMGYTVFMLSVHLHFRPLIRSLSSEMNGRKWHLNDYYVEL